VLWSRDSLTTTSSNKSWESGASLPSTHPTTAGAMSALRSWLRGPSAAAPPSKSPSKTASPLASPAVSSLTLNGHAKPPASPGRQHMSEIDDAMKSASLIMNDDIEGAEAGLRGPGKDSAFHLLGLGLATFMKSVLGFEKDIMAEAATLLTETENRSWNDMKKAQKDAAAGGGSGWFSKAASTGPYEKTHRGETASKIYQPGSEYALVYAISLLMNAMVGVMHESVTEGLKGFYKLRKAFVTLDGIMQAEEQYLASLHAGSNKSAPTPIPRRPRMSDDMMPGSFDEAEFADLEDKDSEVDGFKTPNDVSATRTPKDAPSSDQATSGGLEKKLDRLALDAQNSDIPKPPSQKSTKSQVSRPSSQPSETEPPTRTNIDTKTLFSTPLDAFVHSGTNMCFGILLLLISMVPPAFSRLLYVIGFKGDRDRGLQMLWEASKFDNVNGAMAGLVLLNYYDTFLAPADILPSEQDIAELSTSDPTTGETESVGYPKEKCVSLLAEMRARYPDSRLWQLEEARMHANAKRLDEALEMLRANTDAKMRQITALNSFELSLDSMYNLDFPAMRDNFLRCVELNNWSHSLYYYFAGCAELELYRTEFHRAAGLAEDTAEKRIASTQAQVHKKAAEEHLRQAPKVAGRKRFLARQLPFEVFVCRKLQKWEERAKALELDLVDAVGLSPTMEMIYLWNGMKRMTPSLAGKARDYLQWERCTASGGKLAKMKEEVDEGAMGAVVECSFLRQLGGSTAGRQLVKPILEMDK